jgi:heme-degrading monooxygenase HmoA
MKMPLSAAQNGRLVIIWEFRIRPRLSKQFEAVYGAKGAWARLFRRDKGYLRTELLRHPQLASRYYTLDFWKTRAAYESFKKRHASEYKNLDQQCKALTLDESLVGYFEVGDRRS